MPNKTVLISADSFCVLGFLAVFEECCKEKQFKHYKLESIKAIYKKIEDNKGIDIVNVFLPGSACSFFQAVYHADIKINIFNIESPLHNIRDALLSSKKVQLRMRSYNPLSFRELQVLKMITSSLNDDDVSSLLGISKKTISAHRLSILNKLGIPNRNALRLLFS